MFDEILIFGALGILAGLLAGMFGIGGGLIMVPVLIGTFLSLDFPLCSVCIFISFARLCNSSTLYLFSSIPVKDASNGFRLFSRKLINEVKIESQLGFAYSLELLAENP